MANIKLEKCPFCGGKAKVLVSGTDKFNRKDDGEFAVIQDGWKEATDLWNRRK